MVRWIKGRDIMFKIKVKNKFKHKMRKIKHITAVSELVGSILLLGVLSVSISIIYYNVLSMPPPENPPNVTIISYVENNKLVLEHQKGDSLGLDTQVTIRMDIENETFTVGNYMDPDALSDGEWNI